MTYEPSIQGRKQLLILDECHNVEDQLLKFASVEVNRKEFKEHNLSVPKFPQIKATNHEIYLWLSGKFLTDIRIMCADIEAEMDGIPEGDIEYMGLKKQDVFLTNLIGMCDRLISQKEKGVTVVVDRDGMNSIGFKPLKADTYAGEFLFDSADRVLMMSATVLNKDHFCNSLGLDPKDVCYFNVASPFPIERRPIVDVSRFRLNKANMETNKYEIAKQVKELLEIHKNERGVIHSQSYDLAEFLIEEIDDVRLFLPHGTNRDKQIREYLQDPLVPNGVIISPSIKEGFDFKDDSARFCIMVKAPFASLGDCFVKKRFSEDKNWYYMEALRDIIQSTGRVVRHKEDYAITYLLDGNIKRLIMDNRKYVPDYWLDSMKDASIFKWNPDNFKEK
jgi:Rad3-related DNA helicase